MPPIDHPLNLTTQAILTDLSWALTAVLEPGYPSRAELLDRYANRTGADVSGVNWYATLAMYKLAALYEYSHRRFESGVGDPYYADPGLVSSFLAAGEQLAAADSALT